MESTQVERIYDELLTLGIELEPDPTVLGPRYLNEVISRCRNYLNRATMILLQLQRQRHELSRTISGEEAHFKIESDRLLAENDQVKRLPNIKDREAFVNVMLTERVGRINQLKHEILDIETVEKAVRLRHHELVRTSDNIKTQRSLLLADRTTGAGYGDETDAPRDGKGRVLPAEPDIDENELDRIMNEGEGEGTKLPPEEPLVAPVVVQAPEPPPVVEAAPEPIPEPVKASPEPEPPIPAPEPEPAVAEPAPAVAPVEDEADITRFLAEEEPKKANGKTTSTKGKKKDPKPEPEPQVAKPADEEDFDFSDLLKNL